MGIRVHLIISSVNATKCNIKSCTNCQSPLMTCKISAKFTTLEFSIQEVFNENYGLRDKNEKNYI
ncbi:hypothetical protein BpHYR1_050814 [Brachionus plicatilis]|uniref:Uncharacterized protein n=1 Tax=Brachionus plicatilis TaxID=10195 RepID=A0A3M7T7J6_BRAPC|nr:hypothetical protein BpHYR1_050814 [Brachionus plicatilis]